MSIYDEVLKMGMDEISRLLSKVEQRKQELADKEKVIIWELCFPISYVYERYLDKDYMNMLDDICKLMNDNKDKHPKEKSFTVRYLRVDADEVDDWMFLYE